MASIATAPVTPVPVFATESRTNRADDAQLPVDKTVDVTPESKRVPEKLVKSESLQPQPAGASDLAERPVDLIRPNVRPVIEKLDGVQDIVEMASDEDTERADIQLQASEAYHALRKPDDNLTPVGTI